MKDAARLRRQNERKKYEKSDSRKRIKDHKIYIEKYKIQKK